MATVTFYKFNKRVNSTKQPSATTPSTTASFVYKDETDIHNPELLVNQNIYSNDWNYAKIGNLYFFVERLDSVRNNLWRVKLSIDVLASYRAQIRETSCFVKYAEERFHADITDTRIPTSAQLSFGRSIQPLANMSYDLGVLESGRFVLTLIGGSAEHSTGGSVSIYAMTLDEFRDFTWQLLNPSIWAAIKQVIDDPLNAIISLHFEPFHQVTTNRHPVVIGNYELDMEAHLVSAQYINSGGTRLSVNIPIPWYYPEGDFRRLSCFTKITLFLPFVGLVSLAPEDFFDVDQLTIEYLEDIVTGTVSYNISRLSDNRNIIISSYSGSCKVDLPIAAVQSLIPKWGTISAGIVAGTGLLASGHPAAAATSYAYAFANFVSPRNVNYTGHLGGTGAGFALNPHEITLITESNMTTQEPEDLAHAIGRPLMNVVGLSTLFGDNGGYAQCDNASVIPNGAYLSEIQAINQMLNGGVYLE